jgi:O-antigen/teichoic acid export membrane protein
MSSIGTQGLLRNMSWMTIPNLIVKPAWFLFITLVCIRYMGLAEYGVMTAALALMSICDGSLTLGSSPFTIRDVARDRSVAGVYFSNLLVSRLVMSLVAVGIGLGIRVWLGTGALDVVIFAGAYVFFRNLLDYCRALFRAHEQFQVEAGSTVLEKLLVIGAGTWALTAAPDAASAMMGMSAGMGLAFLGTFAWTTRRVASFRFSDISWDFYRKALPHAIPLGLSSIFVLLYYRTDSIMLETMEGELITGQYGLAFRVTEAMVLLPYIVTSVLLPRLSSLLEQNTSAFNRLFRQGMLGMLLAASVAALAVWILAPWFIPLLDPSPDAVPAIGLLRILLISFVLNAINQIGTTHLTATHRQNRLAVILAVAAAINIGLNLLLIPTFSAAGAAWATVVTQVIILVLFVPVLIRPVRAAG